MPLQRPLGLSTGSRCQGGSSPAWYKRQRTSTRGLFTWHTTFSRLWNTSAGEHRAGQGGPRATHHRGYTASWPHISSETADPAWQMLVLGEMQRCDRCETKFVLTPSHATDAGSVGRSLISPSTRPSVCAGSRRSLLCTLLIASGFCGCVAGADRPYPPTLCLCVTVATAARRT